jgi:lipoate-protein ligase B
VKTLKSMRPGRVPYRDAFELQGRLHRQRVDGIIDDTLVLLEHPHVYTIGRRGTPDDVLWNVETLRARGVEVVDTDRGGMVTYHGPGQLVGYPIIDLGAGADLVAYLRDLEDAIIRTLAVYGIEGHRDTANTGVWVDHASKAAAPRGAAKIAAIGVRVTRNVTKHGFALNVSTDLSYFAGIVPCGISDRGVTSMATELSEPPALDDVASTFERAFYDVFGYATAAVPA